MGRLTLEGLEVLEAIERKGSFAAAAAALYRVPSAVTYTVQKLEEDLGVTLFRREGRRSVLTPAGRLLVEQGRELLEAAERLTESARQVHSGWESRLSIALDSLFPFETLAPHLAAFYAENPDIEITVTEEVLGGAWEAVLTGRADLVVGASELPAVTTGLRWREWTSVDWVFVVAPDHPLAAAPEPLDPALIAAHRAVVVRDSSRQLPPMTRRVFDRQAVLRVDSMQQKIDAQCRGLGAGYLPRHRVRELLEAGVLVERELEPPPAAAASYLGWKSAHRGRALRWFIDRLEKEHGEPPA